MSHGFHSNSRWKSGMTKRPSRGADQRVEADVIGLLCVLHRLSTPMISPSNPSVSFSCPRITSRVLAANVEIPSRSSAMPQMKLAIQFELALFHFTRWFHRGNLTNDHEVKPIPSLACPMPMPLAPLDPSPGYGPAVSSGIG